MDFLRKAKGGVDENFPDFSFYFISLTFLAKATVIYGATRVCVYIHMDMVYGIYICLNVRVLASCINKENST